MTETSHNPPSDIAAAWTLGAASQLAPFEVNGVWYVATINQDGSTSAVRLETEQYEANPPRAIGDVEVRDKESFSEYVKRYATDATVLLMEGDGGITASLDWHGPDAPGWSDHEVHLVRTVRQGWSAWRDRDGVEMSQLDFAEFIEDRMAEIADPPGADLLELAQEFHAHREVQFRSLYRLSDGQVQLLYSEDNHTGQVTVPTSFQLVVRPYESLEGEIMVTARLRWRLRDGRVTFRFKLDEQWRDALEDLHVEEADAVAAAVGRPVLRGTILTDARGR